MLGKILKFIKNTGPSHPRRKSTKKLSIESLEDRKLFAGLPFGAAPDDTAEYMLGTVAVTPVLLESNGQFNANTEDWTPAQKATVLSNIQTGLNWWKQLLATKSSVMTLDFVIDQTYVNNPAPTPYEPISLISNAYSDWVSKFLSDSGYTAGSTLESNIRSFNNAQRVKLGTDWSITIFVVNSQNDSDGNFASGGSFDRAFSFAGGLFEVVPSTRPAETYAHETGHMFWARDEYIGGSDYTKQRGYYNSQNKNAIDLNPTPNFVQADSIMTSGPAQDRAFQNITSSDATLAQIGWVDSDNDGIFDVLDVPLKLEGLGQLNSQGTSYAFSGNATVQTLPNINSSGLQNDITINRIARIEYRINGGNWQTVSSPNQNQVNLNLSIPIPSGTTGTIEIRAVSTTAGIISNVFAGTLGTIRDTAAVPGIQGFVWNDTNKDGQWQSNEAPVSGAQIRLVDDSRQPVNLQSRIEPDNLAEGTIARNQNGILIETVGEDVDGRVGVFSDSAATTGTKVFRPYSASLLTYMDSFRGEQQKLKITFPSPVTSVSIDAVAASDGAIARLDAYGSDGKIIRRFESASMSTGSKVTMQLVSDNADIAFVIARGIRNAKIKLDNLVVGPASATTSAANGSFLLPGLAAGNYTVEVVPPNNTLGSLSPSNGLRSTSVTVGTPSVHADFSLVQIASPWQNQTQRQDVNNDGAITALDVLVIINEINRNGARPLDTSTLVAPPFYDVDGNRSIEAIDVLIVINYINSTQGNGEGEASPWDDLNDPIAILKKRKMV